MKYLLSIILLTFSIFGATAQEKWSLQKCIDYALANNIAIKQQQLNSQYQENQLNQSRYNKMPSVSASLSQNVSFGRSETLNGTYDNYTQANTSGDVRANVVIWQGGILNKTIQQNELNLKASMESLQKAKDDVALYITSAYMEVLFAKELVNVAEKQVEQTQKQIERSKKLVEAGKVAEGVLLEIQSQLAREQLSVVNQKNSLQIALLNLTQSLELVDFAEFDIISPEIPEIKAQMSIKNATNVYKSAVQNRPEIKGAQYELENAKVTLEISESGKLPTLSAYAGISDYYSLYENAPSLSDQISGQIGERIGLSLNIPIFSKFQNRTNIQNSRIQIESKELDLESAKKTLRKEIEQAYTNALAALQSYNANKIAVRSMEESFRYIEEKYNVGLVNSVEYNDAKTNLAVAESDLIQAKYSFVFRTKILDFYQGIPLQL